jgi:hypothetical protein
LGWFRPYGRRVLVVRRITVFQLMHSNTSLSFTHASKFDERIGNKSLTVAVLGEHCLVPHRVVHAQANEPTEEQIVVDLLRQQPLRAVVKNTCNSRVRRMYSRAIDGRPDAAIVILVDVYLDSLATLKAAVKISVKAA